MTEAMTYCSRCKASVPAIEWRLRIATDRTWILRHEGPDRSVLREDPRNPGNVCGQIERIPK